MQCVILAAGRGVRMMPLTEHTPKPLLRVCGKNLIEHNLEILPEEVTEIILVVSYLKEQIMLYFGNEYAGRKITYVEQKEMLGTGHALLQCAPLLSGRFFVMMADDIHAKESLTSLMRIETSALLVTTVPAGAGGKITMHADGTLKEIVEGVHSEPFLLNAAVYVLTPDFFETPLTHIPGKSEYGIPQQLVVYSEHHPVALVPLDSWIHITDVTDIDRATIELKKLDRCV